MHYRVSKWAIPIVVAEDWLPGEKAISFASSDFYLLGILMSSTHRTWMHAQRSRLKGDIAYTPSTCFDTFPFPQTQEIETIERIRAQAFQIHKYRRDQMNKKHCGITVLYNEYFNEPASQLHNLHRQLDTLVAHLYGLSGSKLVLEELLELNLEISKREKKGEPVLGPWISI